MIFSTRSYPDAERPVYLWSPNPRFQLPLEYLTPMNADFFDLQRQNHSFASLSLFGTAKFNVAADGRADALGGARLTGNFFETMGVAPELGRTVNPEDDVNPETIAGAARRELSALDPALAFADVRTMDQLVSEATEERRFATLLLSSFSFVALVVSLVGL